MGFAVSACAAFVAALVGFAVTGATSVVAGLLALSMILAGVTLAAWSHVLSPTESAVEERSQHGPRQSRRQMFLRFGMGAAALTAVGVGGCAAQRIDRSVAALRTTRWRDGVEVVDSDGEPVVIDRIGDGETLTVYPRGAVGSIDSQGILVREPIDRFAPDAIESGAMVDGVAIFSKLCTHMGCSLGLYQQGTGTLLCPCHQAVFDALDVGRAVSGPARRALPWLPFRRADDGRLVATGDFTDAVGAGFWWRP
jgi:ubiquinol-cytochrome c reductase iron-sulfur subunit